MTSRRSLVVTRQLARDQPSLSGWGLFDEVVVGRRLYDELKTTDWFTQVILTRLKAYRIVLLDE